MIPNENICIWIEISLKFTPKGLVDNTSALAQTMVQHWTGNKPLSEPMMA